METHGRSGEVINHKPHCKCGKQGTYNDKYDAYYCVESKVWLEDGCRFDDRLIGDDKECEFCTNRPAKAP
jgi:hypothetical protein